MIELLRRKPISELIQEGEHSLLQGDDVLGLRDVEAVNHDDKVGQRICR